MLVLRANNVNDAYSDALWNIRGLNITERTRNGAAKTYPMPVSTVYAKPRQRMLFDAKRNANPYFHIMESIWMLAGRNDVAFVAKFASNMGDFSDDGKTLNGAYGNRWRYHFGTDQIISTIELLRREPTSRRAVIAMWDGFYDGGSHNSKDLPCNTHIYFRIKDDALDMTVCNRSNDIVWGCYGANAVHMSVLQEFMALAIGIPVGTYTQMSNDWHIYEQHWPLMDSIDEPRSNLYHKDWSHIDLFSPVEYPTNVLDEYTRFCNNVLDNHMYDSYTNGYINWVLQPMLKSWECYKSGNFTRAVAYASTIKDTAVQVACLEWLERRERK